MPEMRKSSAAGQHNLPALDVYKRQDLTAAERGTAVHTCLQQIDYHRIRGIGAADAAKYIEELVLRAEDEGCLLYTSILPVLFEWHESGMRESR